MGHPPSAYRAIQGSALELFAEIDLLLALSTCPGGDPRCRSGDRTPENRLTSVGRSRFTCTRSSRRCSRAGRRRRRRPTEATTDSA